MPTPIFICGAECGVAVTGISPSGGFLPHWDISTGTPTVDTVITKDSAASYKFVGSSQFLGTNRVSGMTRLIGRCYVYFEVLPDTAVALVDMPSSTGANVRIRMDNVSGNFRGDITSQVQGSAVVVGQWYRLDWDVNVGTGTRSMAWKVDGVAQTTVSDTISASSLVSAKFGNTTGGLTVCTTYIDNIELSNTAADFPLGPGKVVGLSPSSDGTHSFTLGDFKYNNSTNVAVAATDVSTYVDDVPITSTADYISQNVSNAGSYIELNMADTTETADCRGMAVTFSQNSQGATTATATANLIDGASSLNLFTLMDISTTSLNYRTIYVTTAPSGGALTQTKMNGLKIRWGFSTGVTDVPKLEAIRIEASYPATVTTMYPTTNTASGSNFGDLQVGGSAPSTSTSSTGWTVGTTAASNYSRMNFGTERLASTFGTTAEPSSGPDNTLGDSFRAGPFTGTFEAGDWSFAFAFRAVTAAGGQDGRVRVRVWKSTSATGASPTEITSGATTLSSVTDLATGADQTSSGTVTLPTIILTNHYLFIQLAWEITGAAS